MYFMAAGLVRANTHAAPLVSVGASNETNYLGVYSQVQTVPYTTSTANYLGVYSQVQTNSSTGSTHETNRNT
jgi:hypothetical protein